MTHPAAIRIILFISLLLFNAWATAVEIQSRVSRDPIAMGESFELIFQAAEAPAGEPDFSPLLKDFEILSQNQSQNIQVTNGEVSRSINWNLVLMPKQSGVSQIPPIMFGTDTSAATAITVSQAQSIDSATDKDDIFIKLEVDPGSAYVQQQVVLRVQLYRAVNLGSASLSEPETDNANTIISKLGEDTQFETRINQKKYIVLERRYTLFPQQSGKLRINPIVFQGEVRIPGGRSSDSFFSNRFGQLNQRSQLKRLSSDPVELDIKPARTELDPWLPASNLQLVETWGKQMPEFRVGEPVTRSFMLLADGLTAVQLPAISQGQTEGYKQYPEQPTLNDRPGPAGTTGIRQEKVAIIPTRTGTIRLPAIEIKWWNTEKDQAETATIPEQEITVLAATSDTVRTDSHRELPLVEDRVTPTTGTTGKTTGNRINWLALALGGGWLFTALGWWISHRHRPQEKTVVKTIPRQKPATSPLASNEVLKQACLADDQQATNRELLHWANTHWPDSPPFSLGDIARRLADDQVSRALKQLEAALYSPNDVQWSGDVLWTAIQHLPRSTGIQTQEEPPLSPLYPA